jgi:hypothetical protein
VRIHFYGDYRKIFPGTVYADLSDQFDQVMQETRAYRRRRLFFGVSTRHAIENVAELAIQNYAQSGQMPERQALIEMYYGEPIPPVSLFITSGKFNAFGMPLLETDDTSLYFTVAPSPYLTEQQLRAILFDHLYNRQSSARMNYSDLGTEELSRMRIFYQTHQDTTLGTGTVRNGTWYPMIPGESS